MKRGKSRKYIDSDHLGVAKPIRPEDLDRHVTRHGVYPSIPTSQGVPWSTYVRSQRVSSRSISSSTEALDSEQARQTMRRILQHTRSLPTNSPVPYLSMTDREYRSDSGLSDRYTTRIPVTISGDRSSYMTEYDEYATLGNRTPTTSSVGMMVRPKIRSVSSQGSISSKGKREGDKAVPSCSPPIIGESAGMFTDMTDTMLKVLDRRAAIAAQARELENTLAENAYALEQNRQRLTGYMPDPVTCHSLSSQPLYVNTMPKTINVGIPVAESTPVPQMGPMLYRPIPATRVCDICEPVASEQARARYLEEQRRHMKSVRPTSSNDRSSVSASLSREIQEFRSHWDDHHQEERETHHVMLESMREQKEKQRQLAKREGDEVYKQMTRNLEKVKAIARESLSRASSISVGKHQIALTRTDFSYVKEKMNKINQKLSSLYKNWQAEYQEALTPEQCEDIRRFYEPHVQKYETKYKFLCQMLNQAIDERKRASSPRVSDEGKRVSSPRGSAPELTPSLAALEDASTLKGKEWNRGEQHKESPHMYSTRDGRMTPTAPTYEDMRIETSLSVTPEDSLEGLSAAVGGTEGDQVRSPIATNVKELVTTVAPPGFVETRPKIVSVSRDQGVLPGEIEVTREASREDALAATRQFFHAEPERRSATEVPATTTTSQPQTDTLPVASVPVETEHPELMPVRILPHSGTPPRPTATATLRPRTWVQRISEGQIERQPQDEDSEENDTLEPLVLEGIPEELGPEWRVLHPFDIPGVRNPTEDTPPTHRRLAENDTLVELIQTAEYLEDVPSWEQRRFYPPRYGDPYYRGCGRGHGRGRGRGRGWLSEDLADRDTGRGRGRFPSRGNERNDQDRNGFPPSVGRDIRLELPPEPARFTDWSSISSPPATFPHGMPGISVEPSENVPNQLNVPATETTRSERIVVGNVDRANMASQTEPIREDREIQVRPAIPMDTGPQSNNIEQNEENVDIIPPVPMSSACLSLHAEDVVLVDTPQGASIENDVVRSSQVISHTIEGISSIHPVDSNITSGARQMEMDDRYRGLPRTSTCNRRDSSDSSDTDRVPRGRGYSYERGRPPERERYSSRDRRPPIR